MAGDLLGTTVLTGLTITGVPGSGVTSTVTLPVLSVQSNALFSISSFGFSILTASSAAAIPSGCLGLIQLASGFSLIYKSGTTTYTVGASAVSA